MQRSPNALELPAKVRCCGGKTKLLEASGVEADYKSKVTDS